MNNANAGFEKSLWSATAEADVVCPRLSGNHDTSVVVIGAGFTGLSTALHLLEMGVDVTVLEANSIGYGASGRNGGQVNPGWKLWPDEIKAKYGDARGSQILQMLGSSCDLVYELINEHHIKCAPRRAPYLRAATKRRGLTEVENWVSQWGRLGMPVELLNRSRTHELMGSHYFEGGFTDARGGSLQPLSYVRGLARAALCAGAKIFTRSAGLKVERKDQDWEVTTASGRVKAKYIVIATNGYTSNLWPGLAKQVIPVASLITATRPLPEEIRKSILPEGHHVSDTRRRMLYFKVDESGRFVVGGRGQALTPTRQYDDTVHLQREALMLYPQLNGIEWEYHWGGLLAMTRTHSPHLIELDKNAYAGLGYNGRGVAMGTMMGRMMAETIQGEHCAMQPEILSAFKLHAFRNIGIFWYMVTAKWLDKLDK
jgi:glycine/D-amino acid oxidase-like deaminating enzyme